MNLENVIYIAVLVSVSVLLLVKLVVRLQLSRAKHPSIAGHSKMSRRLAKLIPAYSLEGERFFACDNAPKMVVEQRRNAFSRLAKHFAQRSPETLAKTESLESGISDVTFTNSYRVPFQFARYLKTHIKLGGLVQATAGVKVQDLDGQWSYDLTGSYGVNVFGYDFYKECIAKGMQKVQTLGPLLGSYHPLIIENVNKLKQISGMDEVSFHMSGTEAVMQAVRLARYHTGKTHLVRFCGAYHGWWDGVQPGIGDYRKVNDVYTLKDMDEHTLHVLKTRKDIACVLINPLQAMHPNSNAPSDSMLVASGRRATFDKQRYSDWLKKLRQVCHARGIVMIMDEVFVGFRLAYGGAQEYFNVKADMVTYGKTLGGGLPVGVVCGKARYMRRFRDDRPLDICFARGTFNSHPYVIASMNEFLNRIDTPEIRKLYNSLDECWNARINKLNTALLVNDIPVKVVNLTSIWTITYTKPSRYNWMFQYYLREKGLALSWIGTGRVIMSLNYSDDEFQDVIDRFISAGVAMKHDGWWWQNEALTDKAIKKMILKEMITAFLGRKPKQDSNYPEPELVRTKQ